MTIIGCSRAPITLLQALECDLSPSVSSQLQFSAEAKTVTGFDEAWAAVNRRKRGKSVSPELRPLLGRVYADVLAAPVDLAALKRSLSALLEYLTDNGRTNANCWAVDRFFCTSEGWERDWTEQNLPDDFHDVLAMMGQALHDSIGAPEIAQNFDCLPEQLLDRVRRLQVPTPVDK